MKRLFVTIFTILLATSLSCCKSNESTLHISVVSIARTNGEGLPGADICGSFVLTKNDVATYFATAEEVDEYEFNLDAIIFPCKYTGEVTINGESFQWEISAGGAGYLYREKNVKKQFLCKVKCSKALLSMNQ